MNIIKSACQATLNNMATSVRDELFTLARADGCVGPLVLTVIAQQMLANECGLYGVNANTYAAAKKAVEEMRVAAASATYDLPVGMKARLTMMKLTRPVRGETLLELILDSEQAFREIDVGAVESDNKDVATMMRVVGFWHPEMDADTIRDHAEQIEALG